MSSSLIDLNRATLDEMNIFLAEHLEGFKVDPIIKTARGPN